MPDQALNVAEYQAKVYPNPPCWNLVADIYTSHLGEAVGKYSTVSHSVRAIASAFRLALHKDPSGFSQVPDPVDYAVVVMGKSARRGPHHCGLYYQGSVLHALPDVTLYQDLASLQDEYPLMEFWAR